MIVQRKKFNIKRGNLSPYEHWTSDGGAVGEPFAPRPAFKRDVNMHADI